ncbi:hypothetical protein HYDPIDRAFT_31720 [Hydnomerulius pinastri MD-312]|uniref:Unplaced genomic scaffold scaffold_32, whole genome shotgun sequence n=1 Tax=Hydnomerulius pinastri MD-312 TaxID=994086 RepID=A0A0C9WB98_9AGAM|nr:hypothetical protein HYDPIDRAFT_31720 [Hydnomerulius pinastri MD-312]
MSPISAIVATPSILSTSYIPSSTSSLYSDPGGQQYPGMPSHVLRIGGGMFLAAAIISVAAYFYHTKRRPAIPSDNRTSWKSNLRKLFVLDRDDTGGSANHGPPRVSAPEIVSSTNVTCDPWYLTGGRPGHVTVDIGEPDVAPVKAARCTTPETATTAGGNSEADGKLVQGAATKPLLPAIGEVVEEEDIAVYDASKELPVSEPSFPSAGVVEDAELDISDVKVENESRSVAIDDDEEDAKSDAGESVSSEDSVYSNESASSDLHDELLAAPLISRSEIVGDVEVDALDNLKSYDFTSNLIGTSLRNGAFLTLPDELDDWLPDQDLPSFTPSRPAPSPHALSSASPSIASSTTSSTVRRYGLADMRQYAKALAVADEHELDPSPEFAEDVKASQVPVPVRRRGQVDMTRYAEALTTEARRPACEPKLELIEEEEEDVDEARIDNDSASADSNPVQDLVVTSAFRPDSTTARLREQIDREFEQWVERENTPERHMEPPPAHAMPEVAIISKFLRSVRHDAKDFSPPRFTYDSDEERFETLSPTRSSITGERNSPGSPSSLSSFSSDASEVVVVSPLILPIPTSSHTAPLLTSKRDHFKSSPKVKPAPKVKPSPKVVGPGDGMKRGALPTPPVPLTMSKPLAPGHRYNRSAVDKPPKGFVRPRWA